MFEPFETESYRIVLNNFEPFVCFSGGILNDEFEPIVIESPTRTLAY